MNTTNVSALALLVSVLCASTAGQAETIRNFTGLNYWDEERAFEGYTLFGAQGNATTYLLDMEGNVVHSWPISGNPRLLDNGNLFARQELDGIVYQSVPNPVDDLYNAYNREAYLSGDILPNSGYLNVTVSPEQVVVDYIRSYLPEHESDGSRHGETAYSYSVP